MLQQEVVIINKLGLHARASAKLTQLATSFKCEVMMLAAAKGMTITIETSGVDESEAMQALVKLINDYFGEGE